jgi:aerobic carbon-monoxide dehydrogenase medium subunit
MKSAAFDYLVAKTVGDAAAALAQHGPSVAIIAGGQSLVPMLNLRVALPDVLIDIAGLEELKENGSKAAVHRIGALTTHAAIEDGKVSDPFAGLLQKVASGISYRAIRNYGTIGGSVALADPAADWPVCLLALSAEVRIGGGKGRRSQPMDSFVRGQYTTALGSDEIILGFDIPQHEAGFRWGSFKVVRKSGAFASSIAIAVQRGSGGPVAVTLGAAGPRPYLLPTIATRIGSGETSDVALREAIAKDLAGCVPEADAYLQRLHTSTVLRAVREMLRQ